MNLTLYVNTKRYELDCTQLDPRTTLLQFLRDNEYVGTKLGCGEGGCGACTVMLSFYDHMNRGITHFGVNACLSPLCTLDGYHVTTIEGIGGTRKGLHPIQRRLALFHGSQCGFCTPGIVMALYAYFREYPNATMHEIEEAMDGNLCRCTGYRPILDAAKSLSKIKQEYTCGVDCPCFQNNPNEEGCNTTTSGCQGSSCSSSSSSTTEYSTHTHKSLEDSLLCEGLAEPIFPPALMKHIRSSLRISNHGVTWLQPIDLSTLLSYKTEFPSAKLVVGNTEVGIETKFKSMEYAVLINPSHVPELKAIQVQSDGIYIGSAITLNSLRRFIQEISSTHPHISSYSLRGLVALQEMINWFASNQIRNVASIGGNIVTASPISDLNPMLCALNSSLTIMSHRGGRREMPIKQFFLSYRKVALEPDEILLNVFIPFTSQWEFVVPFKQARRREDDISVVTAGIRVCLLPTESDWLIQDCELAFGGMAPTAVCATGVRDVMVNRIWGNEVIEEGLARLGLDLALPADVPGGQAEYRLSLAVSCLFRAFIRVTSDLQQVILLNEEMSTSSTHSLPPTPVLAPCDMSAARGFVSLEKPPTRGEQRFTKHVGGLTGEGGQQQQDQDQKSSERKPVGEPLMHKSADLQVSGEAMYTDDISGPANTLHAALVLSTRAHARILNIDYSIAESCPGFIGFVDAKDVVGSNDIGAIVKDEEVFATAESKHYGAVLGAIVASTHQQAVYAAGKVLVSYEDLPAILSISDAIASNSFYPDIHGIESGDINNAVRDSAVVVEGEVWIGGQDHFYLETNCTLVVPQENGQMEVFSSTQNPTKTQNFCALVCGVPVNHVVCRCKRMGGGFGGKETRSVFIACTAAVAAQKFQRPVKINIERDVDMSITGQRHAFLCRYRAGCTADGVLTFMDAQLYSNGGYSLDLSVPIMDRALFHSDNAYRWSTMRVVGKVCRTNMPSNTAFRGFGGPQAMVMAETVMEHLAHVSGYSVHDMRTKNLYREGDCTHFLQRLVEYQVPSLWTQLVLNADYERRKSEISVFNTQNRWRKRGICMLPTKFGISFTAQFYNQGGALVHVYTDGSVLVSHGGTEMGQGLHTKIIQIAARALGISDSSVHISETATNVVPNTSPTAASASTDLYGMAVLDACNQILSRLKPVMDTMPNESWSKIVNAAYFQRINLSAQGFYVIPGDRCGYNWSLSAQENAALGQPFNYFTQGVACTEVEIDVLTGDSRILRADILMDLGKSINPALDIGQIEGAYMQGFGWSTMEELVWGDSQHPWVRPGQLFSRGPGTYKIPAFNDVPCDMRVHLADTNNRFAVHSSKAVGEPPFFLGCSAFFAIKQAMHAARTDSGHLDFYPLNLPATSERIRMGCADKLSQMCAKNDTQYQSKGSW
eukprot:gene5146-10286_t